MPKRWEAIGPGKLLILPGGFCQIVKRDGSYGVVLDKNDCPIDIDLVTLEQLRSAGAINCVPDDNSLYKILIAQGCSVVDILPTKTVEFDDDVPYIPPENRFVSTGIRFIISAKDGSVLLVFSLHIWRDYNGIFREIYLKRGCWESVKRNASEILDAFDRAFLEPKKESDFWKPTVRWPLVVL